MTEEVKPNKTVLHVFKILDAISTSEESIGISEITKLTDLPKTTVFRLLSTLEMTEIIQKDDNQRYQMGPKIMTYSKDMTHQNSIVKAALPYMKAFANKTQENINIGILYHDQVLYLHSEQGGEFSLQVNLFPVAPLYCSSLGKIF